MKQIEIPINEDYRLGVDPMNWIVYRLGTVKDKDSKNYGKPTELAISFNHNIILCVQSMVNDMVEQEKTDDVERIDELVGWYVGKMQNLTNLILSRKEELKEALEINKVL